MKKVSVGILGLGTVGGGTFEVLRQNKELIEKRLGAHLEIKAIATRTPSRAASWNCPSELVSNNPDLVLNDPEIDIVAELIGGIEPARDFVLRALRSGKSVVTANKELLAKHGPLLRQVADENSVDLLFEGAVGGGIPLIKPLRESLAGNRIEEVLAILNGTTNFILSKMTREGADYHAVLAEAQALGYAEAEPSSDVDGFDTQYKLAIVAGIAFDTPVDLDDIFREGITKVSARDIEYAAELGYAIKLVALARRAESSALEMRVHPALLPHSHPLASVGDAFNAIWVRGDAVGETMFYGRGAGAHPTGSAVVGDLIEAARNRLRGIRNIDHAPEHKAVMLPFDEAQTRFCVRMQVKDRPGAIAQIAGVLGDSGVSIESIVQKKTEHGEAEIFWMTHDTTQSAMDQSLKGFAQLEVVREVSSVLRVEGE
ncbi:homoserine dehydrogenase [Abditibacteriota bacterium]|nr:homoserine dehydrogenase [Abditibacteriota bacterium]